MVVQSLLIFQTWWRARKFVSMAFKRSFLSWGLKFFRSCLLPHSCFSWTDLQFTAFYRPHSKAVKMENLWVSKQLLFIMFPASTWYFWLVLDYSKFTSFQTCFFLETVLAILAMQSLIWFYMYRASFEQLCFACFKCQIFLQASLFWKFSESISWFRQWAVSRCPSEHFSPMYA